MGVTININAPLRMIEEVKDFYTKTTWMAHILEDIKERIKANTSGGKDYKSKNFQKYSEAYAKRKGQRRVDLEFTGTMVDAITTNVINALTGVVYVKANSGLDGNRRDILAEYHNYGQGRNPVREFMNIPESVKDKLVKKYINDEVQEIINKHR